MKKFIIGLALLTTVPFAWAQVPQKELVYAVLKKNDVESARISVVQEGLKITIEEESLVVDWDKIELLHKAITELNK